MARERNVIFNKYYASSQNPIPVKNKRSEHRKVHNFSYLDDALIEEDIKNV
jgi:hypothetical protein